MCGVRGAGRDAVASMRPPDLPGGNPISSSCCSRMPSPSFNEAAGFTRRKLHAEKTGHARLVQASMRPPDLPGGNMNRGWQRNAKIKLLQ